MKKIYYLLLFIIAQNVLAEDIYLLETQIGTHMFHDVLIINSHEEGFITGSLTVPGVFSSVLENGKSKLTKAGGHYHFSITAHENGQDVVINYDLFSPDNFTKILTGKLSLSDGTLFGEIVLGTRLINENGPTR